MTDTGPGLDPALLGRCFEPYVTTKTEGSGLGLSVCHGIVQRHRGNIEAGNVGADGGAVFTIRLPALAIHEKGAPSRRRILYVDDDAAVRGAIAAMLKRQGYDVTTAPDGDTALQLAHEYDYDVVLTDIHMVPTSGIDVAAALQRTRPHLPVVLLSGGSMEDVLPGSLARCERLQKPFSRQELAATLTRAQSASRRKGSHLAGRSEDSEEVEG